MIDSNGPTLHVLPAGDGDPEELAELTGDLRGELLDLDDVLSAGPPPPEDVPGTAKGLGAVVGWLVVQLGTLEGLRAVVDAVRSWVSRSGRTVEISIDGDTLKLTAVTAEQQQRIIDAWLARHAAP
ncbi:hypothetical protein ABGB17_24235 [Sphaerisporangium sp. B11E5]|uniref:hypothetical protein n=1 Tax=Sphaerisporangium sp. B11E5 TaxID=3153563 RepID=UPI00325E6FA5